MKSVISSVLDNDMTFCESIKLRLHINENVDHSVRAIINRKIDLKIFNEIYWCKNLVKHIREIY